MHARWILARTPQNAVTPSLIATTKTTVRLILVTPPLDADTQTELAMITTRAQPIHANPMVDAFSLPLPATTTRPARKILAILQADVFTKRLHATITANVLRILALSLVVANFLPLLATIKTLARMILVPPALVACSLISPRPVRMEASAPSIPATQQLDAREGLWTVILVIHASLEAAMLASVVSILPSPIAPSVTTPPLA